MKCRGCSAEVTNVVDTKVSRTGLVITRRRMCSWCGRRWTTEEREKKGTAAMPQIGFISPTNTAPSTPTNSVRENSNPGTSGDLFSVSSLLPDPSELNQGDTQLDERGGMVPMGQQAPIERPPNAFAKAMGQFCEIWRTKYGVPYYPTASDRNQLGRLLHSLPREVLQELPRAFNGYLADRDPFVAQQMRHCLRHFCTSGGMNKYLSNVLILTERTVRNNAAGEQWLAVQEAPNGTKR